MPVELSYKAMKCNEVAYLVAYPPRHATATKLQQIHIVVCICWSGVAVACCGGFLIKCL